MAGYRVPPERDFRPCASTRRPNSEGICARKARGCRFCAATLADALRFSKFTARDPCGRQEISVLWTIFAILLILWLLGWGFHVAGSLIHLLLVLAIIVAIISLVTGRRTA